MILGGTYIANATILYAIQVSPYFVDFSTDVKLNNHFGVIFFEASGAKRTMFFSDRSDLSDESDWSAIRCYHFITRLSLNRTADKP
jgi:hypothetical protein